MNPLKALQGYGQSAWLDYIRRSLLVSGQLKQLIDEDGLMGVTSNPAIYAKAIAGSTDYNEALRTLEEGRDMNAMGLYEQLAIEDIQQTADTLVDIYRQTDRRDGYISLEVSPYLAHDTGGTLDEARRLWRTVGRENVMIKVPATAAGIEAIRPLISEGINVNVTLLFTQAVYEQVAEAYIGGLEAFAAAGGEPGQVASVASFFVSRIDTAVDALAAARLKTVTDPTMQSNLKSVLGKVAIANARLTYQRYKQIYSSERWQSLAARGAQTQRLLWASTGTKNPAYRDVLYVEELIGPDTVNTIPPSTFDAFRDHGHLRASLEAQLEEACEVMETLERSGIVLAEVDERLLSEGVQLFADAFDQLLATVENKRRAVLADDLDGARFCLSEEQVRLVDASLEEWRVSGKTRRLWARDATLWTGTDEGHWLGWLGITEDRLAHIDHLKQLAGDVREAGFSHVLLLGMGGSSLGPEVLKLTLGTQPGFPELHILDSTDPDQIRACEQKINLANTLFIVSSKSGGTLEPNIFKQYFFDRVRQVLGPEEAPRRFIAITDPGSKLQQVAEGDCFRQIYFGLPSIGGRYSVLSNFGLVPAAVIGADVTRFLRNTEEMVHSCAPSVPPELNPGVMLGTVLGVLAKAGRDKVTIFASPGIAGLGSWLEQLLAESTGKEGRGLVPVDGERPGQPEVYGEDRLFVYIRLKSAPDVEQDAAVDALEMAGQPVVRITVSEPYRLGQEFFRWEMATAVAGAILGIHAFNQPDVEASKIATRGLTAEYEKSGILPPEVPILSEAGIGLYTDEWNAVALSGGEQTLSGYIRAHLERLGPGDYFALLAYIEMSDANGQKLQAIRHLVRDSRRVASCLGFGPRFLHSTGQTYKGGPNSGVFVQITCDDRLDIDVPERRYSFGVVKSAQARGDFAVLAERRRRALRVHLGADVSVGLNTLHRVVVEALAPLLVSSTSKTGG